MAERGFRVRLTWNTFWWYVRARRPAALLRAMAWVTVGTWPGELCQECGRKYYPVIWHAPDELWLAVHGSSGGLLCPLCFVRKAEAKGIDVDWRATRWDRDDPATWDMKWGWAIWDAAPAKEGSDGR